MFISFAGVQKCLPFDKEMKLKIAETGVECVCVCVCGRHKRGAKGESLIRRREYDVK